MLSAIIMTYHLRLKNSLNPLLRASNITEEAQHNYVGALCTVDSRKLTFSKTFREKIGYLMIQIEWKTKVIFCFCQLSGTI